MDVNTTSSTSSSVTVSSVRWFRKRTRKERLAAWYMGKIAGRHCPCQWRVRIRPLIRVCGRIDDFHCKTEFRDFAHFHMQDWKTP